MQQHLPTKGAAACRNQRTESGGASFKWLQGPHRLWCYLSHYTLLS
ncbi:hypothetical protein LEMLEM_LOCUS2198, partial [Lemmus lemmus]